VPVGAALHPLTLEQFSAPAFIPAAGAFRLVSGALPPGIDLRPDGSLAGAPTTPGVSTARIEACRTEPPGTCVATDLTVTVTGTGVLPRTGAGGTVKGWALLALIALAAGFAALLVAADDRRLRTGDQ
jgi:hypothetical protein